MKKQFTGRLLVFLLTLAMVLTTAIPLGLGDIAYAASTNSVWTALDDIDAAAGSGKTVAITMAKEGADPYVLTASSTSAAPVAKAAGVNDSGELVIGGDKGDYGWTVTKTDNEGDITYTFVNAAGDYLYLTAANNGVRVGSKPETGGDWKVDADSGYLTAVDTKAATRYVGVYNNSDFRCYTSVNNNIKDQTLKFWAYARDEEAAEVTVSDISDALAAESGEFLVKGAVTLIDGSNIYIQDATGAICARAASAPSGLSVGDTITATGTRSVYNGLPQLNNATWSKVEEAGQTVALEPKVTTIGALTSSDVCRYVTIKDLTVTAVSGTNVDVKDSNNATIQIYKAVLGDLALKAGDVITFTGALGIYKTDYQLRNTTADEITVTSTAPSGDKNSFGLASKIENGDEVILYMSSQNMALGNSIASNKVTGVSLAPAEGVIETESEDVVWTVNANADGTYTFTQGDFTLGGKTVTSGTKTYNNLVLSDAEHTALTLEGPDKTDFNYYLKFADWTTSNGTLYLEYYKGFTVYATNAPTKDAYGFTFYKKGATPETPEEEPQVIGDLITSLDELTDGQTVAIYSASHKTAVSSKPNGDWYLKAKDATITEDGKFGTFTADYVWKVKVNDDGTYSFYANDDETKSITCWLSGNYAELSLDVAKYPDNKWVVTAAQTANSFNLKSATVSHESKGDAYIESYLRNGSEVFSGYFTKNFSGADFALQFYKVDPADASAAFDDGEWDGVLTPGNQYVIYNNTEAVNKAIGLFKEANYALDAIDATLEGDKIKPGNGAYVFTVGSTGRYYTFLNNGKYLASNNSEELMFVEPLEDGTAPETAKWYLTAKDGGYILYNKDANYNGTPVCIEYYSSVFSGWTYSTKNDVNIYLFNFYQLADGVKTHDDVVQDPTAIFDCKDSRCIGQKFPVTITLDDLCPNITSAEITFAAGSKSGSIDTTDESVCEVSSDKKNYTFTITADAIDSEEKATELTINIEVKNAYDITYTGSKTVQILDEPFIEDVTPEPGSQTGDDKKPVVSATIGNAGDAPEVTLTLNDEKVDAAAFADGKLVYTPAEDMADGRTTAVIEVTRADGVKASKTWSFTVGLADYQQYFGQLHSHTTYSDGSGTLETALEYIESLPESANVQFVAFTDHSNYFDTTSAANPADALNDKSQMTEASKKLWEEYKKAAADFNAKHSDIIALAGFEMTWSGGPGHINTFDSDGLVSRNNADLNNKSNDAGMKLYYETINKGESLNQFNHPGATFGNFTDFSYWNEETDNHMFLVEVGNGEGQIGAGGYYPSYEQYTMALDKGWHVAPTNNQDNHKGRWGNANDARDVILTNDFSEQGIYDAIRALRLYSTEDKNLKINYTVNGEPMGTIFSDTPDKLDIEVTAFDPDIEDKIQKVELIANSGKVVHTWSDAEDISKGYFTASLDPNYTYYYVRVTQEDGDLSVTAPVWTGKSASMDIKSFTAPEKVVVGQEATLSATLANNTDAEAKVKSLVYTIGSEVIGQDNEARTIEANSTLDVEFKYTPATAKRTTVKLTAVLESGGNEYTFTKDVTFSVRAGDGDLEVTPISTVQAQTEDGIEYAIEGVVTSNASGYDKDTAFFDCVYVQDDTAGICCFPVSGEYKIGDKVHIEGYTDFYQGEMELQVEKIEVIGEGSVEPTEVTAAQINDLSKLGSLVTLKGTVVSFAEENGLIQTIMVKDAAGDTARVFIDGYITTAEEVAACAEGADITVTGLSSYDNTFNAPDGPFPRIRIRDRKDVVCVDAAGKVAAMVDALPSEITASDKAAVEAARKAYNELSDTAKAGMELTELKLEAAEAKLEAATVKAGSEKAAAKASLADAIISAETAGITTAKYKKASYNNFNKALKAAVATFKSKDSGTADYNSAKAALADARSRLVLKAKNTLTVKTKNVYTKAKTLKRKKVSVAAKKAFTVSKAKGKVTYKKLSGNKKITISSKGKITLKKGLKKGTYKVKVKVTAAGNSAYQKGTKTVTLTVRVIK